MSGTATIESVTDKRALLQVARDRLEEALGAATGKSASRPKVPGVFGGAFVTLWSQGRLRGCIGQFTRTTDLAALVHEVALGALSDPRFTGDPVTAAELPSINIEVSILSDLRPVDDPMTIVPGVHGIVVRQGMRSGCFLPKVATDQGWDARALLENCCTMKAGLPAHAWRNDETEVLTFTADVFAEAEFGSTAG